MHLTSIPHDRLAINSPGGGTGSRTIPRCKPLVWVVAPSPDPSTCQALAFSYGVHPVELADEPGDWRDFAANWMTDHGSAVSHVMLVGGPSPRNPNASHRLEFMRLGAPAG